MELIGKHRLVAHPRHRPGTSLSVEVSVRTGRNIMLSYRVEPADGLLLPKHGYERLDGLWKRTCFEMFVKPSDGSGYIELNFASLGGWNAYSFRDWRKGMAPLQLTDGPHLVDSRLDDRRQLFPDFYELDVVLGAELVSTRGGKLSLTAVIEETDGTRSFWALAHGPGEPDFHHPDCFQLELPAAGPA